MFARARESRGFASSAAWLDEKGRPPPSSARELGRGLRLGCATGLRGLPPDFVRVEVGSSCRAAADRSTLTRGDARYTHTSTTRSLIPAASYTDS